MEWSKLISAKRFGLEEFHEDRHENRTEFQRDFDRLIFSPPFRRLQNKTQVFPLPGSIFVHNRLTHSIEVSCVGRSLGNDVARGILERQPELQATNLPEIGAIVSAGCLAHDLGNPPFGHFGERAFSTFFSEGKGLPLKGDLTEEQWNDLTHFEGNANTFRLLTHQFEGRRKGGFVLTYSTLASIVKYPYSSTHANKKGKFGFFTSERESYERIAEVLGVKKLGDQIYARHPLVYLVEAADDICYGLMDLEDAVDIGIISTSEFERILSPMADVSETWTTNSKQQYCAMLRGIAIGNAINSVADTFMKHHYDLLNGTFQGKDLIGLTDDDVRNALIEAKQFASQNIYTHDEKVMTEIASFPCIASILSLLVPATYAFIKNKPLNYSQKRVLESLLTNNPIDKQDSLYIAYMKILDYIGGMTDDAAARMAREVSGIGMM